MKSVVIIDDNIEMLEQLERFFSKFMQLHIRTFDNPHVAYEYIKIKKTDYVISDISMPGMDGLELLEKIKALNKPPKVVIMTAEATMERVRQSKKLNADDFITKPLNMEELGRRFKQTIGLYV